jgi:5-deoxy-5-amino-3-dehydroquinate synthase
MSRTIEEIVDLGDRTYRVLIGRGARHRTAELLPTGAARVAVVTQAGVPESLIPDFPGREVSLHRIGAGEEHKTLATVQTLTEGFAEAGLTRSDVVVAVGGGLVTDVAGFAASAYHRGIAVVHVATTLLAMVDAAIGGKTGVNLPQGKNLVGAFWQPAAVVCDTESLDSLGERETRCGNGEMAKYHFIVPGDLSVLPIDERVARCVRIKADIVSADEREGGLRALLNYGHTLAHALEIVTDHSLAHGEAVALGLLYAAHLGQVTGRIGAARVDDHYAVVHDLYGLRVPLPNGLDFAVLLETMKRDKKAIEGLTFVLDSPQGLEVVHGVADADALAAWDAFCARIAQ